MSDTTMFDSYRHVKELAAHGLSEACAKSIVNVVQDGFTHHVATKADLAELRIGMQEQFTKLDVSLTALDGRVTNIETGMATKTDIERCKNDITWRIIGLGFAFSGLIITGFFAALQMYLP